MIPLTRARSLFVPPLIALLGACATVPSDRGVGEVEVLVGDRLGESLPLPREGGPLIVTEAEVTRLLAFPLAVRDAERIALYRHPAIGAKLAEVGIAEADLAQASRLRNPGFSFARFSGDDYEATTLFDIGGLMLMPLRKRLATRQLEIAQYQAAGAVIDHLARTRDTWINAVAEAHRTRLMEEMLESVETANSLVRQMTAIGHSSTREAMESELRLTEFRAALSRQRVRETGAREALIRQLGVWGSDASLLTFPDTLDIPLGVPLDYREVAATAVAGRLDVEMARRNIEAMAGNFRLTRRSPFVNAIEIGPVLEVADGERERGFEVELVLPVFDLGGVKSERARIAYDQAYAQAETAAITAASEAREALEAYRRAFDIARVYRERVLPLRERLSKEEMLRYNGMLISVFDLLDDAADVLDTRIAYVDALRDFWLADNHIKRVLVAAPSPSLDFAAAKMMPDTGSDAAGH